MAMARLSELGAYLCAILMDQTGLPYWQAVPATGAIAFAVGFLFGFPALRLEALSLALATFALAIVFPQVVKFRWFAPITGGTTGLLLDRPKSMLPQYLSVDQSLFLFVALWATGMYFLALRIGNSTLALRWRALRDHRVVAEAMGVNRLINNNYAFAVSAMYGGVAGALWTVLTQFVAPDTFGFFLSLTLLVGAVIGGVHSILGALLGAAFIQFIPTLAENVSKSAPWAIYGITLLIVISVAPDGIAGLLRRQANSMIKTISDAKKDPD